MSFAEKFMDCGWCLAFGLCLFLVTVPGQLSSTIDIWQDSDQVSEEIDGTIGEESGLVSLDDDEGESEEHVESIGTRQACQGYTCHMRSSCGRAPLSRIGRPRSAVESYIINGEDQMPGEWPSFARLITKMDDGTYSGCGGTIVSDKHILTATHCLISENKKATSVDVVLGGHNTKIVSHHERTYQSSSICLSKGYLAETPNYKQKYDWAILTLKTRIKFTDYIQPACLPQGFTGRPKYQNCHLVGVGLAGYYPNGTGFTKPIIQKQRVRQVSCASASTIGSFVGPTQACYAKATSIGSTCFGDSGGPILCMDISTKRWTVIGVSATVRNYCDGKEWVAAYTRITTVLPNIKAECNI